ncbi:ankyrin repeat-containing domain protein [Chytriomyces cf. hyalinus JEL632]|nr:ankyrin repeat-containing domain protein [Chytriomyces cf. hyalinus JEL632]
MGFSNEELEGNNIFIAASDGRQDLVEYYLANGCSVTDQDDLGYSVFHAAASYNHISLMQFLLAQPNANASLADHDGDTALHVTETVEMAHLLLAHETGGAALTAMRNSEGKLAIEAADEEGFVELVEFLKEFTPDYTSANASEPAIQPSISEEELMHVLTAADLHENEDGETVLAVNMERLHDLVARGQLDGIVAHQKDVEAREAAGQSPNSGPSEKNGEPGAR